MKTSISFAVLALVNNVSAVQISRSEIPDGYTFNHDKLADSIKAKHTKAEDLRTTAVSDQAARDEWRAGSTPNSGPVLSLNQMTNPADADTYATHAGNLAGALKAQQDAHLAD